MNWLDVALVFVVAMSFLSGIREGFSRSGFGFLAVIAAFLAAAWLSPRSALGFAVVFIAFLAVGGVLTSLLGRWFRGEGLRWMDGVLGGAFGLTNGVLVGVFGVLALMAFAPRLSKEYVAGSKLAPYAVGSACQVAEVVPEEMKARVEESYRELGQVLPPKVRKRIPASPWNKI